MKFIYVGIILGMLWGGCKNSDKPNVRALLQERKIQRLEKAVFALDTAYPDVKSLTAQYGRYFATYAEGVLRLGRVEDPEFEHLFSLFLKDTVMREVYDTVIGRYPDLKWQEEQLAQAWAYYAYYFQERDIPQVYSHISGFNQSVIVDSAAVGVSLDNYLGEDCVFYSMLTPPIPMYARQKMTSRDIPRDVLAGWLSAEFPFRPVKTDLISGMIYQGKIAYVLQKLFPDEPVSYVFGFTPEQWLWCTENESQIWGFFVENEYLFSSRQKIIMKYLNEAPYASGMPVESPGKTAGWTGYRIVEAYMERSASGLEALMQEQDYHKILRIAAYRP